MIKIDFFDFNIDDYEFICHKCMLDDEYKKLLEMEIKGYSRIKMAKDWLEDIDSSNDKLYKYWKYIANVD